MDLCFKCLPQGRCLLKSLRVAISIISPINYCVRLKEKTHHTLPAFSYDYRRGPTLLSISCDFFKTSES